MEKIPDNISMQEVMRFAKSPAGQKLLTALRSTGGEQVDKIKQLSSEGNYTQAQAALSEILKNPQVQSILKEMGRYNG